MRASTGQGSGNNKTHWEVQEEVDFRVQVVVAVEVTVAVAAFLSAQAAEVAALAVEVGQAVVVDLTLAEAEVAGPRGQLAPAPQADRVDLVADGTLAKAVAHLAADRQTNVGLLHRVGHQVKA